MQLRRIFGEVCKCAGAPAFFGEETTGTTRSEDGIVPPQLKCATRSGSGSTTGSSLDRQIDIQDRLTTAYCTLIVDRSPLVVEQVDEIHRRSDVLLLSAHRHRSVTDLCAARTVYEHARQRFDPVVGPSRVRSFSTM